MSAPPSNAALNANTTPPALAAAGPAPDLYLGPGIYLKNGESHRFLGWLLLIPHPDIQIAGAVWFNTPYLLLLRPDLLPEYVNEEQEHRFSLVAQRMDIAVIRTALERMREEMMERFEELMAEMQDALDLDESEAVARLAQDMARRG